MSYTPPLNGGRINMTISGNTAGVGALASTGTVTLAGGNNITLSQNGNAITISGGNAGGAGYTAGMSNVGNTSGTSGMATNQLVMAGGNNVTLSQSTGAGGNTLTISAMAPQIAVSGLITTGTLHTISSNLMNFYFGNMTVSQNSNSATVSPESPYSLSVGASNIGNTSGHTGVVNRRLILVGGNNVTLSGSSSVDAGFGITNTLTISAANQTAQTQNVHNVTLSGNTAGVMAHISSGTLTLAGGNNVTLSQNGNAVTVAGPYAITEAGISNLGNTAGTTATQGNKRFMLAGGNNVTVSQSVSTDGFGGASATVTVSAANQTVQTQNLHNVTLSGNTAGVMAHISSGTLTLAGGNNITLSQNGNAVTISAPNLGAGGADGYNAAQFTNSTADTTMPILWAGNSNGSGNVTMGLTGSTVTASAPSGGGAAQTLEYYQNMDRGTSAALATGHRTLMLQRLNQENDVFAGNLTANTILLNMSGNITATSLSSSHSYTLSIGIYQNQTTRLSLINSASTSWGFSAATLNTQYYHGPRWLSFVSSQWSAAPTFSQGGEYVFGLLISSSNYNPPLSWIGQNYMVSAQRSGTIGTTVATNTSMLQGNFWNAMYSATTTAFPTTIASNSVNRNNATAIFMPHIVLNNRYSGTV